MTPREEANNIYVKMLNWVTDSHVHKERNITSITAKKSALICVDEKQETIDKMFNGYYTMPEEWRKEFDRLEEVKQEINKM